MRKIQNRLHLSRLLPFLCSCIASKDISDSYKSRFASMGFFITTIHMNDDSTLKYKFSGDLINRNATGHYHRKGDTLLLYYRWNKDNLEDMFAEVSNGDIQLQLNEDTVHRERYIIGHNKLYPIHFKTGKKVTRDVR